MIYTAGMSKAVLVVDDDPGFAQVVGEMLSTAGFTVFLANDAATALSHAAAVKPALIVSDIQMPGFGNGADAARAMRHTPDLKATPIIFLSGLDEPTARRMIAGITGCQFLSKPPALADFLALVKATIGAP